MIPAHQLCTDGCGRKRALADGITGCASLCRECHQARMDGAKAKARKKPPKVSPSHKFILTAREQHDALREAMAMTDEDLQLENLEEL